jgi:hypothetical protein
VHNYDTKTAPYAQLAPVQSDLLKLRSRSLAPALCQQMSPQESAAGDGGGAAGADAAGAAGVGGGGEVCLNGKRTVLSACREWDRLVDMCSAELAAPPTAMYEYVMYEYVGMVQVKPRNLLMRAEGGKGATIKNKSRVRRGNVGKSFCRASNSCQECYRCHPGSFTSQVL